MRWRKLGRIFGGEAPLPWMPSYAGVPFAERIDGDLYRIYFTSRDARNRYTVGWTEIDITRPHRILRLAERPLLAPGETGAFDDAGTTLSWVVRHGGKRLIYYIGWSLRQSVPYHLAIGLAVGDIDASEPSVTRLPGPIIERNPIDPLFCTAPSVLIENRRWRMWYVSGLGWPLTPGGGTPSYNTRYAESDNGVDWHRTGLVVLGPRHDEFGFSRASVMFDGQGYLMWYSVRGPNRPYRLDFARSADGLEWTRNDGDAGLEPSAEGWEPERTPCPTVSHPSNNPQLLHCVTRL